MKKQDGKIARYLNARPSLQLAVVIGMYPFLAIALVFVAIKRTLVAMVLAFEEFAVFRDFKVYNRAVKYCYNKVQIRKIIRG